MEEYIWETPTDINIGIAKRIKNIRKRRKITQKQLAGRCNVSYGSLKKFEQTGEISLISLTKIAMELGLSGELKSLFTQPAYLNIEEVVNDAK
jgi:transcriptional regulator with XRE-family HTH domain